MLDRYGYAATEKRTATGELLVRKELYTKLLCLDYSDSESSDDADDINMFNTMNNIVNIPQQHQYQHQGNNVNVRVKSTGDG